MGECCPDNAPLKALTLGAFQEVFTMGSIEKRQTAQGFHCRVRITLKASSAFQKSQPCISETFTTHCETVRWAERTTEDLRQGRFQPESKAEQLDDG